MIHRKEAHQLGVVSSMGSGLRFDTLQEDWCLMGTEVVSPIAWNLLVLAQGIDASLSLCCIIH